MVMTESLKATHASGADAGEWHAHIVRDETELAALAPEWDDLCGRCSTSTAFLSSAWLLSWWRNYGQPGRLVVVLVRKGSRLVGAAALMRRRRFGISTLSPLGVGVSDFTDVLLDDTSAPEASRQLARELTRLGGWQVIDLPEIPASSAMARVIDAWPYRTWTLSGSVCLELPVKPIEELIATLPKSTARTRLKKQRKIDALGIENSMVSPERAAEATATLLRLHQQQWAGRGMNPEHGRSRFTAHLAQAVPAMVERGQAHLVEYRLEGNVVAVDLLLGGHRLLCAYLYGMRPDLRQRIDVTQLLLSTDLSLAQRLGRPALSLLRGDEPYKRRWRPREADNLRVVLAAGDGRKAAAAAYAGAIQVHRRLSHIVRSRLPGLRNSLRRLKTCLPYST